MKIWPVIIDGGPESLVRSGASLLLAPLGNGRVGDHLLAPVSRVTRSAPFVIEPPKATAGYADAIRAAFSGAVVLGRNHDAANVLGRCELSDTFLFLTPECLVVDGALPSVVAAFTEAPLIAHSLVAFETFEGSREHVSVDHSGHVRGIQRLYNQATWSLIAGIGATLVPVAALGPAFAVPESLTALRHDLARRGVMNRDLPLDSGMIDLSTENGLLAANEHQALEATTNAGARPAMIGEGQRIAPEARLIGPVVIHADAEIEADATIVGPTVVGRGARIGRGAVVAHSTVAAGAVIPENAKVIDRLWVGDGSAAESKEDPQRLASYQERLARLAVDLTQEVHAAPADDLSRRVQRSVKRGFDAIAASLALVVLSPLIALCGLAVLIESRGPIFYGDKREGRGGKEFRCWKFRTMFTGAHLAQRELSGLDQTDGPHFKLDHDPRVTTVGRILRALNVDEIPQLFNVVTGDMSLVGPRPSPFRENQVCVPWREARLSVRPGITGFWQVCRHDRAAGDFHQWIEYDLLYVQHQSVWLDLRILAATVLTLGGKAGHVRADWLIPSRPAPTMTRRTLSAEKPDEPDSQAAA